MMNAYGKYAQERNGAWKALIDSQINYLPVNVIQIARRNGIRVYRNTEEKVLKPSEAGKCAIRGDVWVIVYDNTAINEERKYTIAHELGHIFLAHNVNLLRKDEANEAAAESFAQKLMTPLCVLKELGITDKYDIAKTCDVPLWVAEKRAARLKEMIKRNKFYTSDLEKQVYEQFKNYIESEKERRARKL